jgi:glycosyltransferase involved in cell wall biosynthesis
MDTLFQLLLLRKNDVIIVQVFSTKAIYLEYLSVLLGKLKRCYVISTLHGGNIPNQYHHNWKKRIFLDFIFKNSDQITAPSSYIPEQIPSIKERSILIRNIIDLEHYHTQSKPKDDKIRILWMRAYHPTYDPLKAIQVVEYLLDHGHDVEMTMAGSEHGLKKELQEYISSRSCSSKIKLLDVIDNAEKNELASISNVYLCTNIIDNAPVTFLEMMAMGIPIVSTNIGGIPYYVTDHKTALLSTDNSIENIASLIVELHHNKELRTKIITNGFDFIEEFSMDVVGQKWVSLINQSLNRKN